MGEHAAVTGIEYALEGVVYLSKSNGIVFVGGGIQLRGGGDDGELLCKDYRREIHQNWNSVNESLSAPKNVIVLIVQTGRRSV